jgi:predicted nucleic acid-binding protein
VKKILFDTNVVLDVLLDRTPFVEACAAAWMAAETGVVKGMLAAHAVTTIHYLVRKEMGPARAKRLLKSILSVFYVAPVGDEVLQEALESPLTDFEDAVTAAAARFAECAHIVTRDPKGFRGSSVPSIAPEALTALLRN